jgi:fructose-1,6-bisphosphatase/inositol monophosphatase family enzyme/uridine kinase
MPDLTPFLNSAVQAVRASARLIRRQRYTSSRASTKKDGSVVTELDGRCEEIMRSILRDHHPDHAVVGEECSFEAGSAGLVWYLDPLDGTRAYSIGQDHCCTAATLTRDGIPLVAAVAAPFSAELYTAVRGQASRVNGREIQGEPGPTLRECEFLLYYDQAEAGRTGLLSAAARDEVGRLSMLPGSFILSACRTARSAYHLFLAVKRRSGALMPWDLAPAALILEGAGGTLQDLEGGRLGGLIPAREVLAGAPATANELIQRFGPMIRDSGAGLRWARGNEAVFARLCGRVLGGEGTRVIGISGAGGGIGKTSFARELADLLETHGCTLISLDDYLIPRNERDIRDLGAHNPEANDLARATADLQLLRAGKPCTKPVYDHVAGEATREETVTPARFLVVEGVQALHPELRDLIDVGVFLDAAPAIRLRRVARDVQEKGVTESYARAVYERYEADCRRYLLPLREAADVVVEVDEEFGLHWRDTDS